MKRGNAAHISIPTAAHNNGKSHYCESQIMVETVCFVALFSRAEGWGVKRGWGDAYFFSFFFKTNLLF